MTCFLLSNPRGKFPFAPWNCSLQLTEIRKVGQRQRLFLVLSTWVLLVLQTGKNYSKSITVLLVIFSSYSLLSGPQLGQVVLYLWSRGIRAQLSPLLVWWKQGRTVPNCPQHSWNQAVPLRKAFWRIWGKWKGDATQELLTLLTRHEPVLGAPGSPHLSRCNGSFYACDTHQLLHHSQHQKC